MSPAPLPLQAIEVFTGTCLGFIFSTAVQSVVVDTLSRTTDKLAAVQGATYGMEVRREVTVVSCWGRFLKHGGEDGDHGSVVLGLG